MDALMAVFWGVVTFSLLVVMHEGGHFLAARMFGVKVHEFMLGLPGPGFRKKIGQTWYGVTAIPLGGYVRIAGMEPGDEDPLIGDALVVATRERIVDAAQLSAAMGIDEERAASLLFSLQDWYAVELVKPERDDRRSVEHAEAHTEMYRSLYAPEEAEHPSVLVAKARKGTYRGLPTWRRIVVLCAGVAVNLLAAMLVFTVVLSIYGYGEPQLKVEKVVAGGAAAAAGVQAGDTITAIGDKSVDDWNHFIQQLSVYKPGDTTTLTVVRNGQSQTVTLRLTRAPGDESKAFVGIQPYVKEIKPNVFQAAGQSIVWLGLVFEAIGQFFNPATFQTAVSGARSVVGISVEVRDAARAGALSYAWIFALLSLSLGAMNILPIPPLDGGKVLMELVEKFLGHPVSRRISIGISVVGTLMLFSLIGYLMYADVMRYIVN